MKLLPATDISEARTVIVRDGPWSVVGRGMQNDWRYTCFQCDAPLLVGFDGTLVIDIVLGCSLCGVSNESPAQTFEHLVRRALKPSVVMPPGVFRIIDELVLEGPDIPIASQRAQREYERQLGEV